MSVTSPTLVRPTRSRRPRAAPPAPLVSRRQRHVMLLLAALLLGGGATVGFFTLLRPAPRPQFVGLWILSDSSLHGQRQAAAERDRAAMLAGNYFARATALPIGTPTLRQTQAQLAELQSLQARESIVLYVAANATIDDQGRVQLPLGANAARDGMPLCEVLTTLRASAARHKLLVLDLARDEDDAIWPHAAGEVAAAIENELQLVADPHRLVIASCSPGERPRVCEVLGRTIFGASFEQALAGDADGAINGREDGRVSALEIAAYVERDVAHRAEITQSAAQTPQLFGDGDDFDLTSLSLRERRTRHAKKQAVAAREYPKWLAASWAQRDQMASTGAFDDLPRVQRRWEQTLQRAEGQWRGGRDAKDVETDLAQHIAALARELQQARDAIPAPPAHSLAALRATIDPQQTAAADKAVGDLATSIATKTLGLPSDKAAVVRQGLLQAFIDSTAKVDADALAIAIVDRLSAEEEPTADDLRLADQLLRARTPQPAYVETLLVRRLADALAVDATLSPDLFALALRVQHKGEEASLAGRSFGWATDELTSAAQQRYDGEYLLLHPGLAPETVASVRLAAAERSYDRVLALRASLDEAYRTCAKANLRLPVEFNRLSSTRTGRSQWLTAALATSKLNEALELPRLSPITPQQPATTDLERARTTAAKLTELYDTLHRPLAAEQLDQLITAATQGDSAAATWSQINQALAWPGLASTDRQRLWVALESLNIKLYEQCVAAAPAANGANGQQRNVRVVSFSRIDDELFNTRCAMALLRLGGIKRDVFEPLDKQLRSLVEQRSAGRRVSLEDVRGIQLQLQAEYKHLLASGPTDADLWRRSQAASIVPALRDFAWLDAPDRDPAIALAEEVDAVRWQWLASEYSYRAQDDTTQLNSQLVRRYGALASSANGPFIRFDGAQPLARPSPASGAVTATVQWNVVGNLAATIAVSDLRVLTPGPGIEASIITGGARLNGAATLDVRSSPVGNALAGRGVLVELAASGRTWHLPLQFDAQGPSTALEVLLSTSAGGEAIDMLRVRPSTTPQPYFVAVHNPTATAQQVVVEIAGLGQATLTSPAGQTTPVTFPPAPPQPGATPATINSELQVMLRDATTLQTLSTQSYAVDVVTPAQYVRVLETRFDPGVSGKNRLSVMLAASQMPAGPPCMVELVLSPEKIPGLVGVTGGRMRGELLRDGTPLVLTAEGLQLIDGAEEQGEFALCIDGVQRAMTFAADFARRGDATTPRQVARPTITLAAPDFALAGPNFTPAAHVTQSPTDAKIEVRVGRLEDGVLISQLSQTAPSPRQSIVDLLPNVGSTLALGVSVRDWQFTLDATGLVGPRTVEATLVDAGGRKLAVARQSVTFDGTPPESVTFFRLPREALVKAPIDLQVLAADSVSGIDKVFIFSGRPGNGQPPAGAKLIEAQRAPGDGMWRVQLPPVKDLGPADVGVQAINRVGLATCASETVNIVAQLATVGGSIAGTVAEGDRPQAQLEVQLLDASNAVLATVKSDAQGAFLFTDLKPGNYTVTSLKASSQRRAKAAVALEQGQAASVQLELSL